MAIVSEKKNNPGEKSVVVAFYSANQSDRRSWTDIPMGKNASWARLQESDD